MIRFYCHSFIPLYHLQKLQPMLILPWREKEIVTSEINGSEHLPKIPGQCRPAELVGIDVGKFIIGAVETYQR